MISLSPSHPGATDPVGTRREVTQGLDDISEAAKKLNRDCRPQWLRSTPVVVSEYAFAQHGMTSVDLGKHYVDDVRTGMSVIAGAYGEASKLWLANIASDLESGGIEFYIAPFLEGLGVFRVRIPCPYEG